MFRHLIYRQGMPIAYIKQKNEDDPFLLICLYERCKWFNTYRSAIVYLDMLNKKRKRSEKLSVWQEHLELSAVPRKKMVRRKLELSHNFLSLQELEDI